MIINYRDPDAMNEQELLSEIATILVRGYLRYFSQNNHNKVAEDKAPCSARIYDNNICQNNKSVSFKPIKVIMN